MPPRMTLAKEVAVLADFSSGKTDREIAEIHGIHTHSVQAVLIRNGIRRAMGRPSKATALDADQQALVVEHMAFARRVAVRVCREKSHAPEMDEDEYIACAYAATVMAASRWERRGPFTAWCRKWILGAIRDWRRADMLAHGWAWEDHKHQRMVQVLQIDSCPELHGSGEGDLRLAVSRG